MESSANQSSQRGEYSNPVLLIPPPFVEPIVATTIVKIMIINVQYVKLHVESTCTVVARNAAVSIFRDFQFYFIRDGILRNLNKNRTRVLVLIYFHTSSNLPAATHSWDQLLLRGAPAGAPAQLVDTNIINHSQSEFRAPRRTHTAEQDYFVESQPIMSCPDPRRPGHEQGSHRFIATPPTQHTSSQVSASPLRWHSRLRLAGSYAFGNATDRSYIIQSLRASSLGSHRASHSSVL